MAQTILVVDDDPVQRRLLEAAISRSGMNVVTAPGGQPALDLINGPRGDQVTLMLLDLVMPDMGGLEVLEKLRSANPDLPVIVLTAKGGIVPPSTHARAPIFWSARQPERIAVSIRNQLKTAPCRVK
jgi:CheY-like chemotaxis protein